MNKKSEPHRHHYIPQMILRNFANAQGGLYFWRREFGIGKVKATTPANLFLEDDLYTIIGNDGERDVSIEKGFAKLEAHGARIIKEILDVVRSGKTPRLAEKDWQLWDYYHYFAAKRSVAWHERFVSREEAMALVKTIKPERQLTDAERDWVNYKPGIDRAMKNARITAQGTGPPEELIALMRSREMVVYVAPHKASFIIGDHPLAMAKVISVKSAIDDYIAFMPVASDIAIGYFKRPRRVYVENVDHAQLRVINEAMTLQSVMIAGRSEALPRSLSKFGYESPEAFTTLHYLMG